MYDDSDISLEQLADDWLNPDYQYEGSQSQWLDWSVPSSNQEPVSYETSQPSLNIPWREQPDALVGPEVIQRYTTPESTSWLDKIGDAIAKVGPSLVNIFGSTQTSPQPSPTFPVITAPQPAAIPRTTVITQPGTQSPGTNVVLSIAGDAESALGPNWMIYAAIGVAAYFLLR